MDLKLPKGREIIADAGFIIRLVAFFLDILILNFIIIFPFAGFFSGNASFKDVFKYVSSAGGFIYAISFYIAVMIYLYFTVTEYAAGQSIGKRIMKIHVVSDKSEIKLGQILLRNLAVLPFFPFFVFWIIDPAYMMFSKNQRRLSDIIAQTKVIQVVQYG